MITMTKSTFTKRKAQMKSSSYYLFWGIATVAVVSGQVYVGTGYRAMAKSMNRWFEETIDIMQEPIRPRIGTPMRPDSGGFGGPEGYYMPVPSPEDYGMTIVQ